MFICIFLIFSSVFSSIQQMIATLIGYVVIVVFYWTKTRSLHFMLIGQTIWFLLLAYVCTFFGALQVPAFVAALLYSSIGFAYNWKYVDETADADSLSETRNLSIVERCAHFWDSPILKSTPTRPIAAKMPTSAQSVSSPVSSNVDNPATVLKNKMELNVKTELLFKTQALHADGDVDQSVRSQSAIYFKVLFLACLVTILYKQFFVLALCSIPIVVYLANKAIVTFGLAEWLHHQWNELYLQMQVTQFAANFFLYILNSNNSFNALCHFVSIAGLYSSKTISVITIMLTRPNPN